MFISPTDSSFLRAADSPSSIRLQEVRDRFESVVDHVIDGIITVDDAGLIEGVNPAAELIFGYPAPEMIGQHIDLLVPEPFSEQNSGSSGREAVGRRKDGSVFAMDVAFSRFLRSGREYYTGIIRDISERKKLELEQQEANERLRSVVDHVADGIVTIDERGLIASFNQSAE